MSTMERSLKGGQHPLPLFTIASHPRKGLQLMPINGRIPIPAAFYSSMAVQWIRTQAIDTHVRGKCLICLHQAASDAFTCGNVAVIFSAYFNFVHFDKSHCIRLPRDAVLRPNDADAA